jgi:uncharacterized protein YbaR (Trm112 family)/2-polyprenyl-3-methyl-5-hydroxy-6-metoxy-1,4-benzoquinol methylase
VAKTEQKLQIELASNGLSAGLLERVVCPRDKQGLRLEAGKLRCPDDHSYAVIDGVPILLVGEARQTHSEGVRSLQVAETGDTSPIGDLEVVPDQIDPFVQDWIGATNGNMYRHLIGKLQEYPIPRLRLPPGDGASFLEIGCSWGRWCVAAGRAGYRPVGIDPSLKGVRAAQRVARQLGISALYLVADGRYLPFRDGSFQRVFSYSVLQHLSPQDLRDTVIEIDRVLSSEGNTTVQMANAFGVRCLYHQLRRGFREAKAFEVRYWTPRQLRNVFETIIGPSRLSVDGFLSLNAQLSDARFLSFPYRAVVYASEALRLLSTWLPPLTYVADSLYVSSSHRVEPESC